MGHIVCFSFVQIPLENKLLFMKIVVVKEFEKHFQECSTFEQKNSLIFPKEDDERIPVNNE